MRAISVVLLLGLFVIGHAQHIVQYRQCTQGCTSANSTNDGINTAFAYGTANSFITEDVVSDYGMRDYPSSIWHEGTDLSSLQNGGGDSDRGDALVAIEGGTISRIQATVNYKYVTISGSNYGYGHIFNSLIPSQQTGMYLKSGKFVLKQCEPPFIGYYAIVDLEECIGYSDLPSAANVGEVLLPGLSVNTCNGTTIYASNYIFDGKDIAPMGDASTQWVHLHLYRFKHTPGSHTQNPRSNNNNIGDPFYTIQHQVPSYTLEMHSQGQTNNNVSLIYPGTTSQGLKVRTTMQGTIIPSGAADRFSNVAMNISRVEFRMKPKYSSNFGLLKGQNHESKIWLGATQDMIYPDFITSNYGNWHTTGQYPYAYSTNNPQDYDDFYFADFITRIHSNDPMDGNITPAMIADCPQNARYNDGPYELKAAITDVMGTVTEGPVDASGNLAPVEFTLDNFQPFIQSVDAYIAGEQVYNMHWSCNNTCGPSGNSGGIQPHGGVQTVAIPQYELINPSCMLEIVILASEPLQNLTLDIVEGVPGTGVINNISPIFNSSNMQTWIFEVPFSQIQNFQTLQYVFEGVDFSSNNLLNLENEFDPENPSNNVTCVRVPTRQQSGWSNPDGIPNGTERAHYMGMSCVQQNLTGGGNQSEEKLVFFNGTCLLADFDWSPDESDGCKINFTDFTIGFPISYFWDFGDGAIDNTNNPNPSHTYQESGTYTVILTVSDGDQSSSYSEVITVVGCGSSSGGGGIEPDCMINGPSFAGAGQTISLTANAFGMGPFYYEWIPGTGLMPSSVTYNQIAEYVIPEYATNGEVYSVTLNITDAQGNTETCTHYVEVSGQAPELELWIFGEHEPGAYMYFVGWTDFFNVTGFPTYQFTIDQVTPGTFGEWVSPILYDYDLDICHAGNPQAAEPAGEEVCLEAGEYHICVYMTDDAGTYVDCKNITIGTLPPPPPEIEIVSLSTGSSDPFALEFGECDPLWIKVNNDPFSAQQHYWSCSQGSNSGQDEFIVDWKITNLTTGETLPTLTISSDEDCGYMAEFKVCNVDCAFLGTISVTAEIYTAKMDGSGGCCGEKSEYAPFVAGPFFIDLLLPENPVTIEDIEIADGCEPFLKVNANSGCRRSSQGEYPCANENQYYQNYEWKAYDFFTNEPLENFFTGNEHNRCILINPSHAYFENFNSGELARFKCEVIVTDYSGAQDMHTQLVFMNVPLRANVPVNISRCPDTAMPLLNNSLAVGGAGDYNYKNWNVASNPAADISLDDSNPDQPLLVIPEGYAGEITVAFRITDGNDCYVDHVVTVSVSAMSVNIGPEHVIACNSGPGAHHLGPVVVTGGSGDYTYAWSPVDYLDDPGSPNPLIVLPNGATGETYHLTVLDGYGCSVEAGPVTVEGASATPVANAGPDQTVCYNTSAAIGNNPQGQEYLWTSTHPEFAGSEEANPVIPAALNRGGGTYTYTVWGIDPYSGCYAEDVMHLTALDRWLYEGYNSEVVFVNEGSFIPLWNENAANSIITAAEAQAMGLVSGATPPFTYSWLENIPPYNVSPVLNAEGIPGGGEFKATEEIPHLTLHVEDGYGCSKEFKTNRALTLEMFEDPDVEIRVTAPSSPVVCPGEDICFVVILKTHFNGDNPWLLPQRIDAAYTVQYEDLIANLHLLEDGVLELSLVNANEGIYATSICYAAEALSQPSVNTFLQVEGTLTTGSYSGGVPFSGQYNFTIGYAGPVNAMDEICDNQWVSAIELYINPDNSCNNLIIDFDPANPNKNYKWRGGYEGFVAMDGFTRLTGYYTHAFIDRCLTEGQLMPDTVIVEERMAAKDTIATKLPEATSLNAYPNPFTGEVTIRYSVQSDEGESSVMIRIVNMMGSVVEVLASEELHANGEYSLVFKGHDLVPGVYYIDMVSGESRVSAKLIKVR